MRKCRSCGYLLLGEADACARCGAPLAVVTVGAATPAPTPAAPAPSTPAPAPAAWPPAPAAPAPAAPPAWAPPPAGAPSPLGGAQPLPALRESWQPVAMPPSTSQPRSTRLGLIALAVAVSLAVGAGVMHLRSDPLPSGTSAFVAGGGITYDSADGAYEVLLPKSPVTDQRVTTVDGVSATIYAASAETESYVIGAASITFPNAVAASRVNAMLDAALTGGVNGSNGKLVSKSLTMHGTLPAIEGRFNAPDGYSAHLLVVASGSTLIMLIVHAKSGTDRLYKALENSLIIR